MKILKFSADWCGPCKTLQAVLDSVELPVEVENINIDENEDLTRKWGVRGVPTMIKISDSGQEITRQVGALTAEEFLEWCK